MSLREVVAISVGLIIGWVVVSRIMTAYLREPYETSNGDWFEVLGVPPDATRAQIDAAYDKNRRELHERELRIMTTAEQKVAAQKRAHIDAAYHRSRVGSS